LFFSSSPLLVEFASLQLLFRMTMECAATNGLKKPIGGATTILLGSDDSADMFSQRQAERETCTETPDAVPRFPQAPGGFASISLSGGAPDMVATRGPVGGSDSLEFGATETMKALAPRGPIGGAVTLVLGGDSSKEVFDQRHKERHAEVQTPDAAPRFHQAPGGAATLSLQVDDSVVNAVLTTRPVGGQSTVLLGCEDSKEMFAQQKEQQCANMQTPNAAPRFQQAPGGNTSICLANGVADTVALRGPVGGGSTIVLGSDDASEAFSQNHKKQDLNTNPPNAAPRFQQAPGGTASLSLGSDGVVESVSQRGPIGGASTIAFGTDNGVDAFIRDRPYEMETPEAAPRFQQAPGGTASICLSDQASIANADHLPTVRGAVGGATTILLGGDNSADAFGDTAKNSTFVTPDAAQRFQQAPGGSATISLGGEDPAVLTDLAMIQRAARRAAPGPETTIVLGGEVNSTCVFSDYHQDRGAPVETPDAPKRFQQEPGGSSSICLGGDSAAAQAVVRNRGPVGGSSSIVLGSDDQGEVLAQHDMQRVLDIKTPGAAPRFQQAPGGSATIQLGNEGIADAVLATSTKGPVGGAATIVFGSSDDAETLADRQRPLPVSIVTPNAAPRYQQAPGGTATLQLGNENDRDTMAATPVRGPVGGSATIVLGGDDPSEAFAHDQISIETPAAPNRFTQAPGGTATVVLGGAVVHKPQDLLRQAPGGLATIVLGGDPDDPHDTFSATTSSSKFANGANQNCGNTITDRPTTRLHHAPGGASTICLGDDSVVSTPVKKIPDLRTAAIQAAPTPSRLRQSPGGEATICFGGDTDDHLNTHGVSSSKFANGANQNCGNTITDRPTTRLHHAPGGASTLCLGSDDDISTVKIVQAQNAVVCMPDPMVEVSPAADSRFSSNAFASGANQNCGNFITDRPTTRLHHAPGGASTLSLGHDDTPSTAARTSAQSQLEVTRDAKVVVSLPDCNSTSSNKFASGVNQNCGNSITDRPTTRVHQAPGGTSSVCLGGD